MKIITEGAVYVQKNDIANLNSLDVHMPGSIYMKTYGFSGGTINRNRFDFIKFESDKEIEFFKAQDWIIDYDEVKDLSDDEIIKMRKDLDQQANSIPESERKSELDVATEFDLLQFKRHALRDFLSFRYGDLQITLPEGIDLPKGIIMKDETIPIEDVRKTNENKIQKLIYGIFPKIKK